MKGWADDFHRELRVHVDDKAHSLATGLFGRWLLPEDYARLGCASPGSNVVVKLDDEGDIQINCSGPLAESEVGVQRKQGRLELVLGSFTIRRDMRGQHLGARLFGLVVHQAVELGLHAIVGYAVRGEEDHGYYTWPRFGFDGRIPDEVRPLLPEPLRKATSLLELMQSAEGRQAWREHGRSVFVVFDLSTGSLSRRVLDRYLQFL